MSIPYFSIIIPVYNVQNYVAKCLKSVSEQSFQDFEVIIVNDGSTDQSLQIIKNFLEKSSPDFHLINQENLGLSMARNNGFKKCQGRYILFLDSDDTLSDDALHVLHEVLEKNSDLDYLNFARSYITEDGNYIDRSFVRYTFEESEHVYVGKEVAKNLLEYTNVSFSAIDKAYSRRFLEVFAPDIFKPKVNFEDHIFAFSAILKVNKVVSIKKKLLNYLVRENSIMRTANTSMVTNYVTMIRELWNRKDVIQKFGVDKLDLDRHILIQIVSFYRALYDIKSLSASNYTSLVKEFKNRIKQEGIQKVFHSRFEISKTILAMYVRSSFSSVQMINNIFFYLIERK